MNRPDRMVSAMNIRHAVVHYKENETPRASWGGNSFVNVKVGKYAQVLGGEK